MAASITGLDIVIKRMQALDKQFESLASVGAVAKSEPDKNFQAILNSKVSESQDKNNKTFYTNNKSAVQNTSRVEIENLIEKYSEKNGLDKDFVKALIRQESGFNPKVTSRCGAMGLMQLMPSTAQGLGVKNAYDAEQNIAGGTKYLKSMINRFGGDEKLALAAYNAGPNAVKKYGGIPPYQETQNYVKNVLSAYNKYKGEAN